MTDGMLGEPDCAAPLDDVSGLLRDDSTTRGQLDSSVVVN
jgi:hypothetical protein